MKTKTAPSLLLLLALAAAALPLREFIRNPELQSSLYFKTSRIGDIRSTLVALPTVYAFAVNDRLGIDAASTPALAFTSQDGSSILRLSNTKFRLSYNHRDFLLGTLGVRIPTGLNQFTGEQLLTAGNLSTRQLAFQQANLFNTLDLCAGLATSLAFKDLGPGDLALGLGFSGLYKGAFEPLEGDDNLYTPGNEFNASFASEYTFLAFDRKAVALADFGYTLYGKDEYLDASTINRGSKFNWSLSLSSQITRQTPFSVRLANYIKGANENPAKYGETAKKASDLIFSVQSGLPFLPSLRPYGKLALASYTGGGADGYGDALIFSAGGGISRRLAEHLFGDAELGADAGSLEESAVFGLEGRAGFTYQF